MNKLAVIGVGNMASAIIGGILKSGLYKETDLRLFDKMTEKLDVYVKNGAYAAKDLIDVIDGAEYILLSVKPQNIGEVLGELKKADLNGKTFISICAGISTSIIEKYLGKRVPVVRVMPNTPLQIGLGVSAVAKNNMVSDKAFDLAVSIFESSGMVLKLDESKMNAIISVNGSSPAYFYYFIAAMCDSAKAQGLSDVDDKDILNAVCNTVIGSAKMLMDSGKTPEELIRAVTSPKGTTEKAMNVLYEADVASIIDNAMRACTDRAVEMAKEAEAKTTDN